MATWDAGYGGGPTPLGSEEGWHKELIVEYPSVPGRCAAPMGRTTRPLHSLYAQARRMRNHRSRNLMLETIGATTYRLALRHAEYPSARHMLTILTPVTNRFTSRSTLAHSSASVRARSLRAFRRLRPIFHLTSSRSCSLPFASRPKAKAFDRIERAELSRAYAEQLGRVLPVSWAGLMPARWLLRWFGVDRIVWKEAGLERHVCACG